jgi:hypothetical protein
MKWIIIVVVLLAAFGPVLWLVPSKKDRRLARMRQRARANGLRVDITTLPDTYAPALAHVTAGGVKKEPKVECAVYWAVSPRQLGHAPSWRILRIPEAAHRPAKGPLPGWAWDSKAADEPGYWQGMAPLIQPLPTSILAVETNTREVGLYWQERVSAAEADDKVDEIAGYLNAIVEEQRRVDAEREAAQQVRFEAPGDSDDTAGKS